MLVGFQVGRLVSGPRMLEIVDLRSILETEVSQVAFEWFGILVSGLGIEVEIPASNSTSAPEIPLVPCLDVEELHQRNISRTWKILGKE